eukprot:scaffold156_cov308-Prasinococcus_capsulatus_cf.AAC.16
MHRPPQPGAVGIVGGPRWDARCEGRVLLRLPRGVPPLPMRLQKSARAGRSCASLQAGGRALPRPRSDWLRPRAAQHRPSARGRAGVRRLMPRPLRPAAPLG